MNVRVGEEGGLLRMCDVFLHHDETAVVDEKSHCDSNAPSIPGDEISMVFRLVDIDHREHR